MAVVLGVWVLTVVAGMFLPGYNPPQSVSMAVSIVLGGLFGGVLVQRGQKWIRTRPPDEPGESQETEPPPPPPGPHVARSGKILPPPNGWDEDNSE
jgi:hypothetical protein